MFDFDNDGFISPEDVRIIMSYMPFNRNDDLINQGMGSPSRKALMRV